LGAAAAWPAGAAWAATRTPAGVRPRALVFPADFGAHPATRIEWWYATGWLVEASAAPGAAAPTGATPMARLANGALPTPQFGFQVTFFRTRTGVAADHPSAFAARQLVFAHAAVTDLAGRRLRHDQRIARSGFGLAGADEGDTGVVLRDWHLRRAGPPGASVYTTQVGSDSAGEGAGFALDLQLAATQPVLLQGLAGYSRKGPAPEQASHYYSQPQLAVSGTLRLDGAARAVQGRAWLDHEWSDSLLDAQAVGWDWIGMNLADGSALTAFRLRRADGSSLYAGGSFRAAVGGAQGSGAPAGGAGPAPRNFGPDEVRLTPGRTWASTSSRATYPVEWRVDTPVGTFTVKALLDDQELDSRGSTGTIYWEGLSELRDASGRVVGHGYLEMTGYAGRLNL